MGWLGIALILVIAADVLLKEGSHWATVGAMLLGILAAIPVQKAYKALTFGEVAIYWASGVLIASLLVAHFYYQETLSWQKMVGGLLALSAIYLTGK